jgi:hypothetical protein
MPSLHELPFLAPIPRGHEVLVVTFASEDKTLTAVLDRTASSLYCPEALWGPLHQDPVRAVTDPVAVITRWAWTLRSAVEGVCAGAMMSTKSWGGDRHEVKTILLVEVATTR